MHLCTSIRKDTKQNVRTECHPQFGIVCVDHTHRLQVKFCNYIMHDHTFFLNFFILSIVASE